MDELEMTILEQMIKAVELGKGGALDRTHWQRIRDYAYSLCEEQVRAAGLREREALQAEREAVRARDRANYALRQARKAEAKKAA